MTTNQLKRLGTDDELRKRLAKLMAQQCFRNTEPENLHAGTVPSSRTGDYTDVKVVTPYGEIIWPDLSRLSDAEMKVLMIEVVNKKYTFLTMLFTGGPSKMDGFFNAFEQFDLVPHWNEPEITNL